MSGKISIVDVARLAGVSKSTVSRVVSDQGGAVSRATQEKIVKAIHELGYTKNSMASGLRTSKTFLVLLMVPDISNPFWAEITRAIQARLEPEGYFLVLGNTDWSEERQSHYLDLVRAGRFDGVIANSVAADIGCFEGLSVPVVMIGERAEGGSMDVVGSETYVEAMAALEYLYGSGHRRIAIALSQKAAERKRSRRYRAYVDFLRSKGLRLEPELVFTTGLSAEGGAQLAAKIVALREGGDSVSAVLCGNDLVAIEAINAFRATPLVPGKDISIVGMDDIPAAALTYPALTTIRKPRAEMGRAAAALLLDRLGRPERPPEKHLFSGELVVRESVGAIRA
jgi:DNA-binding LacI/PurR family transcriptional regulator